MYKQLTSQQRSQIFALLQRKTPRKEIALIVGCSQSTLCRELKRNSTTKGNYLWDKAHAKALERRKRTTSNKKLDSVLVWRIKQMIIDHQWSPEQIRGVLAKENVSVDMIIQSYARKTSNTNDIAFTINSDDLPRAMEVLEKVKAKLNAADIKIGA